MKKLHTFIPIIAISATMLACDQSQRRQDESIESNPTRLPAATEQLRSQLSKENGGKAFEELLRMGSDGFEQVIAAIANGEVGTEDFTDWTYDFQTRSDDGKALLERFETRLFLKAEQDAALAEDLASNFYSKFPVESIEQLQNDSRPGARRVAEFALKKPRKRNRPSGLPE